MSTKSEKNEYFNLFGVPMCRYEKAQLESALVSFLNSDKIHKIAKVNTEFLGRALKDEEFKNTLASFDLNIADGSGVLWAAKYLQLPLTKNKVVLRQPLRMLVLPAQAVWQMIYSGASLVFYPKYVKNPIPERFPGVQALYLMLETVIKTNSSVYFLGAEKKVNEKTREVLAKKYPKLNIAGGRGGIWKSDEEVVEEINKSGAKLLIVALGSPKQEKWIERYSSKLKNVRVAVGEGGSLDRIAGTFKLAPKWMEKTGLEWLWRAFANKSKTKETGHRVKRVWRAVPVFIFETVRYKINNCHSEFSSESKEIPKQVRDDENK